MEDLNWINLKFRELNWTNVKLENWNKLQSNLKDAICILALLFCYL